MKKNLWLIFLLIFTKIAYAQDFDIFGKWRETDIVSPKDIHEFKDLTDGLSKSTFDFKENNKFEITSTNPTKSFRYIVFLSDNGLWMLEDKTIVIRDKVDHKLLMKVFITEKDDKTLFTFYESDLVLEVEKITNTNNEYKVLNTINQ